MAERRTVDQFITLDENGRVIIQDEALARTLQEFTPEQLARLAQSPPVVANNSGCNHSCEG